MKKLIIALFVLLSLNASAQKAPAAKTDTVKLIQPPATLANYILTGKLSDFQLMALAIFSPGDVTPNQKNTLSEWINKNLQPVADSATKKK